MSTTITTLNLGPSDRGQTYILEKQCHGSYPYTVIFESRCLQRGTTGQPSLLRIYILNLTLIVESKILYIRVSLHEPVLYY